MASKFERAIGSDVVPDLIAMRQKAQTGWVPPTEVSRDEYQALKLWNGGPSALKAFVGFNCSFAGKWFGGYAQDGNGRNYAAEGSRSVVKRAAGMKNAEIYCVDYTYWTPFMRPGVVVYCDPPYANTLQYAAASKFDHETFWETMRDWTRRGAQVFVSEYTAPDDFTEIWSIERHTSTALDSKGAKAVDKLFTLL